MDKLRIGQKLSLSILLLFISNLITIITAGTDINIFMALGFISFFIPLLLVKKELPRKILSWLLLVMSIVMLIDSNNDISNMNGVFLFLFSLSISIKPKKIYVIYFTVFISALMYKFNTLNSEPSQVVGYFGGITFIGFIYQHYIHPKKQGKQYIFSYVNLPVKRFLVDAMVLYVQDKTWNEIAEKIAPHKTGNSLRKEIKKEITKLGMNNYADFVLYLGQYGIIKQVDKNTITD